MRLLDIDLGQSGITYEPGDVLAMVPQQTTAAVEALCRRCGWDPHSWVRVEPVLTPAAVAAVDAGAAAAEEASCSSAAAGTCSCTVRLGALVAGALDINGASPRRFFFQASRWIPWAACRLVQVQCGLVEALQRIAAAAADLVVPPPFIACRCCTSLCGAASWRRSGWPTSRCRRAGMTCTSTTSVRVRQ